MDDEAFFRRIEAARDEGETDISLAGRLGIDVRTYHGWLAHEHRPSSAKKDQVLDRLRTLPAATKPRAGPPPSVPSEDRVTMSSSPNPLREAIKTYADTLPEHELLRAVSYLEELRRGLPHNGEDRGIG